MQILSRSAVAAGLLPAQIICCTDRAEFQAAAAALIFFGFDECRADPEFTEYPDGLTVYGVHFGALCHADFPASLLVYTSDICGFEAGSFSVVGQSMLYAGGVETLRVTLPAGVTAFGLDFSAAGQDSRETLHASVNGETFAINALGVGAEACSFFAGFLSTSPIAQINFSGSDSGPIFLSVCYGHTHSAFNALRTL